MKWKPFSLFDEFCLWYTNLKKKKRNGIFLIFFFFEIRGIVLIYLFYKKGNHEKKKTCLNWIGLLVVLTKTKRGANWKVRVLQHNPVPFYNKITRVIIKI